MTHFPTQAASAVSARRSGVDRRALVLLLREVMKWPSLNAAAVASTAALVALAGALVCWASAARAEPSDAEVRERLTFIERRLRAATPAANQWSYGWFATFSVLAVGQVAVGLGTTDPGLRADMAVGAVSSSVGALPFALFPFAPRFAAAKLARLPEQTPEQRKEKLRVAEHLLRTASDAEVLGHGWVPQIAGVGVAVAWGLVLGIGYKRVRSGIVNTVIGIGIAETQIFTQPTAAIDDWSAYSKGDFRAPEQVPHESLTFLPVPFVMGPAGARPNGGGLTFSGSF